MVDSCALLHVDAQQAKRHASRETEIAPIRAVLIEADTPDGLHRRRIGLSRSQARRKAKHWESLGWTVTRTNVELVPVDGGSHG